MASENSQPLSVKRYLATGIMVLVIHFSVRVFRSSSVLKYPKSMGKYSATEISHNASAS